MYIITIITVPKVNMYTLTIGALIMNGLNNFALFLTATAGSSADEQRTVQQRRQVSFKSPTRERKQSASPPHSDSNRGVRQGRSGAGSTGGESTASSASGHSTSSHERKVKRR